MATRVARRGDLNLSNAPPVRQKSVASPKKSNENRHNSEVPNVRKSKVPFRTSIYRGDPKKRHSPKMVAEGKWNCEARVTRRSFIDGTGAGSTRRYRDGATRYPPMSREKQTYEVF